MKHILQIIFLSISITTFAGSNITSPFTKQTIELKDSNAYSFIVSGHFYGNKYNNTGYPTHTLLANIEWINKSKATMLMVLGDLFMDIKNDIPLYEQSFFSKLNKPLFNTVGNHDLTANVYQDNYGKTYDYFILNNTIHLLLDSELNDGNIEGEQLVLLKKIESIVNSKKISHVFIYTHRTLWARSYTDLDKLFLANTQSTFTNNFETDVLPILNKIQLKSKVVCFAGSLGEAPAAVFNYKSNTGIQYIATAIRGYKKDAFLIVNVNNGEVSYDLKSLTNQKLESFDYYNLEFWNKNIGQTASFNYRLLPLYLKQMVLSYVFWIGLIFGMVLILVIRKFFNLKTKSSN